MPSPIKAVRLVRFRGFADERLELRPLTVLLGPNSAGKSSFGQALAGLKQVHARGAEHPDLRDVSADERPLVDLGEHADLAHAGSKENVQIHVDVEIGTVKFGFGGTDNQGRALPGFPLSFLELPTTKGVPQTAAAQPITGTISPAIVGQLDAVVQQPLAERMHLVSAFERISPHTWAVRHAPSGFQTNAVLGFQGLRLIGVRDAASSSNVSFQPDGLAEVLRSLERAEYLQPTRLAPQRLYERRRQRGHSVGPTGEHTPFVLLDQRDRRMALPKVPPCPDTPDSASDILKSGTTWCGPEGTLVAALSQWMQHLELARAVVATPVGPDARLDVTLAGGTRALTEVGFGLSQVLPILVAGLCLDQEGILIVEQPEGQLHPRPQAALADFFCFLAKTGRGAIVETHSEAFFHRLRLRAAMDDDLAAKIAVYALDRPDGATCCEPKVIDLAEDREMNWPMGFMTDGGEEALSLLAVRAARHRRDRS